MSASIHGDGGLSVCEWHTLVQHARRTWGFKEACHRLAVLLGLKELSARAVIQGQRRASPTATALNTLTDQLIAAAERDLAELRAIRERQNGSTAQVDPLPVRGVARRGVGASRGAVAPVAVMR